ncbi:MAG: carboxypeptidase-like regulatory domain-containing protein [Planctomycetota bacterium]|nr:carboxypeptidase-like regulatory domain-containing protein [Planctomycetota bacterium]
MNKPTRLCIVVALLVLTVALGVGEFLVYRQLFLTGQPREREDGTSADAHRAKDEAKTVTPETSGDQADETDDGPNQPDDPVDAEGTTPKKNAIAGVVQNTAGAPIEGAEVETECDRPQSSADSTPKPQSADPEPDSAKTKHANRKTMTDTDGRFRIDGLHGCASQVTARAKGYASAVQSWVKTGRTDLVLRLAPGATLFGKVTRRSDGSPVAGAEVKVTGDAAGPRGERLYGRRVSETVKTGEDGYYLFDDVHAGPTAVVVRADAAGLAWEEAAIELAESGRKELNFSLADGGAVSGLVSDASTGAPIAGVRVVVEREDRSHKTDTATDESGSYRFVGIIAGQVLINTDAQGYLDGPSPGRHRKVTIVAGKETTVNFALKRDAEVSGCVTDEDGVPVADAGVTIWGDTGTERWGSRRQTDREGEYRFDDLAPGRARVTVRHQRYVEKTSQEIELHEGEHVARVDLVLARGGEVSGRVLSDAGAALARATVTVWDMEGGVSAPRENYATTDANGFYRIQGVKPGVKRLAAQAAGYVSALRDDVQVQNTNATKGVDFTLVAGLKISGTVRDQLGNAVEQADVRAMPRDRYTGDRRFTSLKEVSARTDSQGYYELAGLAEEPYDVAVRAKGYKEEVRGEVVPGNIIMDFTLVRSGKIAGRIVNWPGDGYHSILYIYMQGAELGRSEAWSCIEGRGGAADGTFEIDIADSGTYAIDVAVKGHGVGRVENIVVRAGETTGGIEVRLERGTKLVGRVLREADRSPVQGATVSIERADGSWGYSSSSYWYKGIETDANGSFTMEDLQAGAYVLKAMHAESDAGRVALTIAPGQELAGTDILLLPKTEKEK